METKPFDWTIGVPTPKQADSFIAVVENREDRGNVSSCIGSWECVDGEFVLKLRHFFGWHGFSTKDWEVVAWTRAFNIMPAKYCPPERYRFVFSR